MDVASQQGILDQRKHSIGSPPTFGT